MRQRRRSRLSHDGEDQYLRNLAERREAVKRSIEEQGKLTEELSAAIDAARTLAEVEDLYRPYKQKRRTRATIAREKGLAPLAELLFAQGPDCPDPTAEAARYVDAEKGVETVEELLHDYPRAYDAYEEPVPIGKLREKGMFAVSGQLMKTPSVRRFKNIQVIITDVRDMTGALQLTWYNMPYLRNVLQMGQILIFRGRVVKKSGRLTMEQPDVFTPEQYRRIMHSMQPVYGQTKGLGNKAITRAVQQALEQRQMEREY